MHRLRLLIAARPLAALWLVACVLAVRMLVPAGYMPVAGPGGVSLGLCPGAMPAAPMAPAPMAHGPMAGMHHGGGGEREEAPAGAAMPCAFAGLGSAAVELPGLAVALVAPFAADPLPTRGASPRSVAASIRWRPPLRAPPLG